MPSRFYLPHSGPTPQIAPLFTIATANGSWESTASAVREVTGLTKRSTAMATINVAADGTSGHDIMEKQYVSPRLAAQAIGSGATVKGVIRCFETNALDNFSAQTRMYV